MRTTDVPFRLAVAGLAAAATVAPVLAVDKLAVKAGRVLVSTTEEIEDGVIVIEEGRITAVGPAAEVEIPWDANVL